jgi:glutamate synthase (NADPH/NADH) small chain
VAFAQGEGRFAPHFAADGSPSPEIIATRDERRANWRTLKELAGIGRAEAVDARPPADFAETARTMTADEARAAAASCLQCPDPTCVAACPIRIDIPRYLEHVAVGDFAAAAEILLQRNPMPAVTSRVCAQELQCEGSCKRVTTEGTVPIGEIERFVAEWAREHVTPPPGAGPSGRTVAVVGAGPAGLACAGELAARGHAVTVYDQHDAAGGILRYGIPAYRLPREHVDATLDELRDADVRFETGVRVGENVQLDELRDRFDAVFVATGAGASVQAGIPGEALDGVMAAAEYLERASQRPASLPTHRCVVVLGGGNAAVDAARTALRRGAEQVSLVYRRGRAEMPAYADEVAAAEREGVRLVLLASPVEVLGDDGRHARAVRLARMALGEADESGRAQPVATGELFELEADIVITALGTVPEAWLSSSGGLATDAAARVGADEHGRTSLPMTYAGGDVTRGPATVVLALDDGLRAAEEIDRALRAHVS